MELLKFQPALGQRYVTAVVGQHDDTEVITQVVPALTLLDAPMLELRSESKLSTRRLTFVALAAAIASGDTRPAELNRLEKTSPVSLQDLVERMSDAQRWAFTDRVAYVLAVESANVGLSWKNRDFCMVVEATFVARHAAALKSLMTTPTGRPVRETPPSVYSVDRWFRSYRATNRDLRVLAREVLVTHFRKERRPDEKKLLRAFLESRRAEIGVTSGTQLAKDFNHFAKSIGPDAIDHAVEDLLEQAQRAAARNATVRKARGSMHKKSKPVSKAAPANKGVYMAVPPPGQEAVPAK